MPPFLRSRNLLIFTLVVAAQGATGYILTFRSENQVPSKPLAALGQLVNGWQMLKEWPIEPEVQAVLRASDTLSRVYGNPKFPQGVGLFVAFFQTQRSGVAPHSPKNCLPGNGWVAEKSAVTHIPVPGRAEPVEANNYVVQRGDNKSVVVYWYQSHGRTVADEYRAKFFVMSDAIRYNRTDTALIRVTAAVGPGGVEAAEAAAREFVRDFSDPLSNLLPK